MKLSAILAPMLASKADHALIEQVILAYEAAASAEAEKGKEKARARWHKWNEGHKSNGRKRLQTPANVSNLLVGGDARVEDKTSNLEIEPQKKEQKERNALTRDFEDWYAGYPHKVGRGAAERAFPKALSLAGLAELKAGVSRYIQSKPAERAWQNPSTWLNNKGWLDQPANVVPMARGSPRPMDEFISSVLTRMDEADAVSSAQIERYPTAPRRLSGNVSG